MITEITLRERRALPFPPGPHNDLAAIRSLVNNPALYLARQTSEYGDISSISLSFIRLHFLNHPELIRELIADNPFLFPRQKLAGRFKKRFGRSIPATAEGEEHKGQRKLLAAFFARNPVQHYRKSSLRHAGELGASWKQGQVVDMRTEMANLTASIVSGALFSVDAGTEVLGILHRFHESHSDFGSLSPLRAARASLLKQGPAKLQYAEEANLDAFILRTIARRRASGERHEDILDQLLQTETEEGEMLSDEMIRAHIVTLFWASLEATTEALSWSWYTLDQHPEVQARVMAELEQRVAEGDPEFAEQDKLVYLRQVVSETLRLYPPFWILSRTSACEVKVELDGKAYGIAKGQMVSVSQYLMNRDPRYWEEPETFNPDRFAPENADRISRSVFFPFGMGLHRCIGEMFSWMEILTILSTLLYQWKAVAASEEPVTMRSGVTVYPVGLNLRLESRRHPAPSILS